MELNNEFMNVVVSNENIDYFDYEIIKNRFTCRYDKSHNGRFNMSCPEVTYEIKKWAYDNGYSISSNFEGVSNLMYIRDWGLSHIESYKKETEFEAVYKAGLWVFEKLRGEV